MTLISIALDGRRPRLDLVGGPLAPRLISADATGATVALVATTALLLGGDDVRIDVRVGPGARLEIVETAGTVAYDAEGEPSSWTVRVHIAAGGLLLWHGEPFVVSHGANVLRDSVFELGAGATACLRETVVLGRSGERGGALRLSTRVCSAGTPLLVEQLDLTEPGTRSLPGILGAATVLDSVTALGGAADWSADIDPGSRFHLDGDGGTVARVLRSGLAGSPAGTWWAACSRAARGAHSAAVPGDPPAPHHLPPHGDPVAPAGPHSTAVSAGATS